MLATRKLSSEDTYYFFDFADNAYALLEYLQKIPEVKCKLIAVGNSRKNWDSYNWNLSTMLLQIRSRDEDGMFDVVYLDGAHTFLHDGLAICMLKILMKHLDSKSWRGIFKRI